MFVFLQDDVALTAVFDVVGSPGAVLVASYDRRISQQLPRLPTYITFHTTEIINIYLVYDIPTLCTALLRHIIRHFSNINLQTIY